MAKAILITGTSSGFGNDVAKTLASAGHQVFATMRGMDGRQKEVANDLQSRGIQTFELDVTSNTSVDAALKAIYHKTGGKLDVLVNNAGLASGGLSESFTPEQLRDLFEVNVFGVQRMIRAATPGLEKSRPALIINMGSILGRVTIPFFGLYGASKHAMEAINDTYRYELSQLGIEVVLVQPGPYPTGLYADTAIQKPSDNGRAEKYGEVAALPGKFAEFLGGVFSGPDAPKPHDVTEAIVKLIDTPAGQRPDRVVVGSAFGADVANEAIKPIQAQLIGGLGFDHLSKVKIP
jgi:NAD(P)-dependent dehydrogenase (short-subunit alcohol dehydrogenase family)